MMRKLLLLHIILNALTTFGYMRIDRYGSSSVDVDTVVTNNALMIGLGSSRAIAPGTYGNVTIPQSYGGKTVRYIAPKAFMGIYRSMWNLYLPSTITHIGDDSFYWFSSKLHFTPENLISIGKYAFQGHDFLESGIRILSLPNLEMIGEAALSVSSIREVNIPKILEIPDSLFSSCTNLTNVVVSSQLTEIGSSAFYKCGKLQTFNIPATVRAIWDSAFYKAGIQTADLPQGLVTIGDDAFHGCKNLRAISIPSSVKYIGCDVFADSAIEELIIEDNTQLSTISILGHAEKLKRIRIGDGLKTVGYRAFEWCPNLEDVELPQSVETIAEDAFSGSTNLTIHMTSSLTNIQQGAFSQIQQLELDGLPGNVFAGRYNQFLHCSNIVLRFSTPVTCCISNVFGNASPYIRVIEFPDSMTELPSNCCWGCTGLRSVRLPSGLTSIGRCAFKNCTELKAIVFPTSLTAVGDSAFENSGLTNFDVSANCNFKKIGRRAFYCSQLSGINLTGTLITNISDEAFVCTKIKSIDLTGTKIYDVGQQAFMGSSVENVLFPNTIKTLGVSAFKSCVSLGTLDLPGIKTIPSSAFSYCSLTNIVIHDGTEKIESLAFGSQCVKVDDEYVQVYNMDDWLLTSRVFNVRIYLPSTLRQVHEKAFTYWGSLNYAKTYTNETYLSNLAQFYFNGDAPEILCDFTLYKPAFKGRLHVYQDASGWDDNGDGMWDYCLGDWHGAHCPDNDSSSTVHIPIVYRGEFPELEKNSSREEIHSYLIDLQDEKIRENISDIDSYNAFRDWQMKIEKSYQDCATFRRNLTSANHLWLSFALGSETLIEAVPTDGDLKVDDFEPSTESGKFNFTVSVKDIQVGSDASADNLKKVFGLEGGTSLEPGGLSSANVNITFGTPENGKVKFTAGPKNANEGSFFMRVKMTP